MCWEWDVQQKIIISRAKRCLPSVSKGLIFFSILFFSPPYSNCGPPQAVLAAPGSHPQHKCHHAAHSLPKQSRLLQASGPSAAEAVVLAEPVRRGRARPAGTWRAGQGSEGVGLAAPAKLLMPALSCVGVVVRVPQTRPIPAHAQQCEQA